jgi:hypothetical protein
MRAGWWALIVGLLVGGGLVLLMTAPGDDGLGPVVRALRLERGPDLDARRAAAVAAATERCLAALGIRVTVPVQPPPPIPDPELDPVAWAERWGFGISTAGGWDTVPAPTTPPPPPDARERRCAEAAAEEVYGLRERLLAPLRPALKALGRAIDADAASGAADARWTACVADATTDADPDLPTAPAPGRLDALRAWFTARAQASPGASVVALERRVAAAIARCDLALADARRSAAEPHEQAFVRTYAVEIARIGAAIRAAEAAYPTAVP